MLFCKSSNFPARPSSWPENFPGQATSESIFSLRVTHTPRWPTRHLLDIERTPRWSKRLRRKRGEGVQERHPTLVNGHFLSRWLLHPGDAGVSAGVQRNRVETLLLNEELFAWLVFLSRGGHAGACLSGSFRLWQLFLAKGHRWSNGRKTRTQSETFGGFYLYQFSMRCALQFQTTRSSL